MEHFTIFSVFFWMREWGGMVCRKGRNVDDIWENQKLIWAVTWIEASSQISAMRLQSWNDVPNSPSSGDISNEFFPSAIWDFWQGESWIAGLPNRPLLLGSKILIICGKVHRLFCHWDFPLWSIVVGLWCLYWQSF